MSNFYPDNSIISRFTYTYDAAGNRTEEGREDGSSRLWKYDPTSQLISETRDDGVSTNTTTFAYDPVGNRLVLNEDGALTTSTYDAANRLQTSDDGSGTTTYVYDANGNQRTILTPTGEVTTYSWNYENQLDQLATLDGTLATYQYAPVTRFSDELTISKQTASGTTNFIWDNQNIIREIDSTGALEAEYTLNPQAYGNLISQRRSGASSFYHFDALGSTRQLTDSGQAASDTYLYDAWGVPLTSSGTTVNPFRYVGQFGYYYDPDTGNYYIRARIYDSLIGRWKSIDPLFFIDGMNRYLPGFVPNMIDPDGMATTKVNVCCKMSLVCCGDYPVGASSFRGTASFTVNTNKEAPPVRDQALKACFKAVPKPPKDCMHVPVGRGPKLDEGGCNKEPPLVINGVDPNKTSECKRALQDWRESMYKDEAVEAFNLHADESVLCVFMCQTCFAGNPVAIGICSSGICGHGLQR